MNSQQRLSAQMDYWRDRTDAQREESGQPKLIADADAVVNFWARIAFMWAIAKYTVGIGKEPR